MKRSLIVLIIVGLTLTINCSENPVAPTEVEMTKPECYHSELPVGHIQLTDPVVRITIDLDSIAPRTTCIGPETEWETGIDTHGDTIQ